MPEPIAANDVTPNPASLQSDADLRKKVWDMIARQKIALLSSWDGQELHMRPMGSFADPDQSAIWFFTRLATEKTGEMQRFRRVNVAYADHDKSDYISLSGQAEIVRDRAKIDQFWNSFVQAWFPEGRDDPDLALLRFDPEHAEYWDGPASSLALFWQVAKANLTGKKPDMGDNARVDMTH